VCNVYVLLAFNCKCFVFGLQISGNNNSTKKEEDRKMILANTTGKIFTFASGDIKIKPKEKNCSSKMIYLENNY